MNFQQFATAHGLIIDHIDEGRWCRVRTTDKPRSRNGSYKFLGSVGWVQNWATMVEPAMWRDESTDNRVIQQSIKRATVDSNKEAQEAADKAEWILSQCELKTHEYLINKGFVDEMVHVWAQGDRELMVVPMRIGHEIAGCQLIDQEGNKKFLSGQRSGGASFTFFAHGPHYLCEGYATALSVRHALKNLKAPYTLHVCFSAANMARIAAGLPGGLVVADNDKSGVGERTAKQIGWPYWMSDQVGEDADDYRRRKGLFALANGLRMARGKAMT